MWALLLAAAACAASGASAAAEAPWTLARGSLVVDEIPTGNAWQTRSYLLSDTASGKAAVRALNIVRLSPYAEAHDAAGGLRRQRQRRLRDRRATRRDHRRAPADARGASCVVAYPHATSQAG